MTPKLTKLWHNEMDTPIFFLVELRADFDNDLHYSVMVEEPHGPREIARALDMMAGLIFEDLHLERAANA